MIYYMHYLLPGAKAGSVNWCFLCVVLYSHYTCVVPGTSTITPKSANLCHIYSTTTTATTTAAIGSSITTAITAATATTTTTSSSSRRSTVVVVVVVLVVVVIVVPPLLTYLSDPSSKILVPGMCQY